MYKFNEFCEVYLIKDYEDPMVLKPSFKESRFENYRTRDCPLFCRSAPWTDINFETNYGTVNHDFEDELREDDLELENYDKETHFFRTKYQIGFVMNPKNT